MRSRTDENTELGHCMAALLYFSVAYCPYCKPFATVWARTVALLRVFRVPVQAREIECAKDGSLAAAYGVDRFPSILLDNGRGQVLRYEGARKPELILNWVWASGAAAR